MQMQAYLKSLLHVTLRHTSKICSRLGAFFLYDLT